LGVEIPLARFRARVGGEAAFRKIQAALSVTEKIHPGCPRGMARITRHAYETSRGAAATFTIPRTKVAPFLRAGAGRTPLIDGIRVGSGANAPLPLPRRLDPGRLALEAPLYSYQEAAVEHLCGESGALGPKSVAAHRGVAYLQMDTGLGKSRVGLGVVVRRGEPALIVVPTEAIGEQWLEEMTEVCPGLVGGFYHNPPKRSRKVPPGPATHDVVVVIVNTLRAKPPEFLEGYGTVILDEAHEYHSACNGRVLWLAQTPAVLGLSATPRERPDELDQYVCLHLGAPIYPANIPGFDAAVVKFRGEVRIIEYAGHPAHCETAECGGSMSAIGTINNVLEDPYRLRLVVAEVERIYRLHETSDPAELARLGLGPRPAKDATPKHPAGEMRRHGVFVFAETRAILPVLREALLERFAETELLVPELDEATPEPGAAPGATTGKEGPAVSLLRGGVAKGAVSDARRAGAHIVLVTLGFGRRGISLPDMTAIVNVTPRRNGGRQILGRTRRRGSDESILRLVSDIVDVRTGLKGQAADRRKLYAAMGYPFTKVSVSWEAYAGDAAECDEPDMDDNPLTGLTMDELLAAALGDAGQVLVASDAPLALTDEDIDALLG
jgi:African swine fever virus helicase